MDVPYRLSGRRWQRDERSEVKYFLTVEATEFHVVGQTGAPTTASSPLPDESEASWDDDDDDDVPF